MAKTRVVVVGGGFGGLNATKILSREGDLEIVLIDRRNHHLFQPLLYQVATAGLSPADIATPIRSLFSKRPNVSVLLDEVTGIDLGKKQLQLTSQILSYDYLVLACGASHSYFGKSEWEEFAPGLKTLEQATEIRRRILRAFEDAEKGATPEEIASYLHFVIVGGGPTGVELAGAIVELARNTLKRDYRHIDPKETHVSLIEAGPRILAAFHESLSTRAKQDLESLGVKVMTGARVTKVTGDGVEVANTWIASKTVIWAAGVAPSATGAFFQERDPQGRVMVNSDLSVPGHPDVFVIGDQAHVKGKDGKPLPGLAPVAMQQGRAAARNILKRINQKPTVSFQYLDKGAMATIGRKRAVVEAGKLRISGLIAWFMWLSIHIYYLIGFRNRLFVFLQWAWSYLTFSRGARLIVDKDWKLKK